MSQLAQTADGLHPAEPLFDKLPLLLTDRIPRVPRGSTVNGASSMAGRAVLRQMRRRVHRTELRDEVTAVVALVCGDGDGVTTGDSFDHHQRGISFAEAVRRRHRRAYDQAGAMLHEHVAQVAESCLTASR